RSRGPRCGRRVTLRGTDACACNTLSRRAEPTSRARGGRMPGRTDGAETVGYPLKSAIWALAANQHGVITRAQLLKAGIAAHVIDRRLKMGRLRPMHRGVYLVGPLRVRRTDEMAAVLACGGAVVVSHRSAGVMWELLAPDDRAV